VAAPARDRRDVHRAAAPCLLSSTDRTVE
jgi:hypothetical protein